MTITHLNRYFDDVAKYAANRQRWREVSLDALNEIWLTAFEDVALDPSDLTARADFNDLKSEFYLRGETSPYYRVGQAAPQYMRLLGDELEELQKEYPEGRAAAQGQLREYGCESASAQALRRNRVPSPSIVPDASPRSARGNHGQRGTAA
jgi:hypothetical protein